MKVNVHMLAFNDKGTIREVDIPDYDDERGVEDILNDVFHNGQNDFQPQQITTLQQLPLLPGYHFQPYRHLHGQS